MKEDTDASATPAGATSKEESNDDAPTATSEAASPAAQEATPMGGSPSSQTAATPTETPRVDTPEGEDEKETPPQYHLKVPNNRINVASNQPTRTYMTRAKKILRSHDTMTIGALGMAMSIAVELAEMLVNSHYATKLNIRTSYVGKGDQTNLKGPRKPCIEITMGRGEYGELVSGYRQRKVTDLFERLALKTNNDGEFPDNVQYLRKDVVRKEDFHVSFFSEDMRLKNSNDLLDEVDGDTIDLPTFIRYMSKVIDPLLLDRHFNDVMRKYNVEVPDRKIRISAADG